MPAKITTANARKQLEPRGKPYFRNLSRGLDIGYRKNENGGVWVVRRQKGSRKKGAAQYESQTIAIADDDRKADGDKVLNYDQAKARAENWQPASASPHQPITVKIAVAEYLAEREKEERAQKGEAASLKRDAKSRLTKHVIKDEDDKDTAFAATKLEDLSEENLAEWREALEKKAATGRNGSKLSETSIRRTVNDLKASLNAAQKRYRKRLPATLPIVIKNGLATAKAKATVARPKQVLPDADVRAIIDAAGTVDAEGEWGGDLSRMILVLAATGARFSQVIRLTVADVHPTKLQIMMPVSAKGRGEKAISHIRVRVGEDVIKALRPILSGRKGAETLLLRPRWHQEKRHINPTIWTKEAPSPWLSSSELLRPWAQIVAKAELSSDLVPYALRHSSIVRALNAGLNIRHVAALHDTSSAMIERHYAAHIVDAMDELAAKAVVPLITEAPTPLRPVEKAKA